MQEEKLYEMFKRRRSKGMPVSWNWLRAKMLVLMRIEKPAHYLPEKHKFRHGWAYRFCKRWKISRRRRTNTKKQDLFERMHHIRRFHWWSVYQFANPQNYPKYWDRSKLPQIPESDSEESDSPCSESESVSDSSYESDTNSSETPSEVSDDSSKHSSSSEESSENSS